MFEDETIEIYSELVNQDFDEVGWDPVVDNDEADEDDYGYYKGII